MAPLQLDFHLSREMLTEWLDLPTGSLSVNKKDGGPKCFVESDDDNIKFSLSVEAKANVCQPGVTLSIFCQNQRADIKLNKLSQPLAADKEEKTIKRETDDLSDYDMYFVEPIMNLLNTVEDDDDTKNEHILPNDSEGDIYGETDEVLQEDFSSSSYTSTNVKSELPADVPGTSDVSQMKKVTKKSKKRSNKNSGLHKQNDDVSDQQEVKKTKKTETAEKKPRAKEKPRGPCICEVCGKYIKVKTSLYLHLRAQHGIGTPLEYKSCELCDKKFYLTASLRNHMARHLKKKVVICDLCGKDFINNQDLKKHRRFYHEGIDKYHCEKCGHGMNKLEGLRRHVCGRTRRRRRDPSLNNEAHPGVPSMSHQQSYEPEHSYIPQQSYTSLQGQSYIPGPSYFHGQ